MFKYCHVYVHSLCKRPQFAPLSPALSHPTAVEREREKKTEREGGREEKREGEREGESLWRQGITHSQDSLKTNLRQRAVDSWEGGRIND